jgi:luciferase family oxidoreductase group 1
MSPKLSVLDLSPVSSGMTAAQALHNTLDLARHADRLGFHRCWLAEHHNMPGIAGSSPEILIGQVARETSKMRVGSGGVMLPNHAPLQVAERFQTLEALFPGRIDLGIGRAPGSDPRTALALRRAGQTEELPAQLADLFGFAGGQFPAGHPLGSVAAVPFGVRLPPVWLLGSSDYSAQVAAALGLGFAFAHHINPSGAEEAMRLYRNNFTPSEALPEPEALVTASVICADTDAEAEKLAASFDLAWLRLYAGRPSVFPSPEEARTYPYSAAERAQVQATRSRLILGSPQTVRAKLCALAGRVGAGEIMATTFVHDHEARKHSYTLLAEAFGSAG